MSQFSPSILILEDDVIVARFVEDVLHSLGHERTRLAHDGESALASADVPDLAFLDIHLGQGPDGIDVAGELKKRGDTQIIFITAYDDNRTLDRAVAVSPVAYLLKPFDEKDLRVVLRLALRTLQRTAPGMRKTNLAALDVEATRRKIEELVGEERLFLDPELTFGSLAVRLGITTHQLSEIFNRVMGVGFRDYLRRLRVTEACRRLEQDPASSVLRVGLDVGFNSRSTFHDAFRKVTGLSPEEYRKKAREQMDSCARPAVPAV